MTASEAKALVDSKPQRDAESERSYRERRLTYAYDIIKRNALRGYSGTFVPFNEQVRAALEADGYTCKQFGDYDIMVTWENPK